jgi:MYXO-CTERM domain-containing protein
MLLGSLGLVLLPASTQASRVVYINTDPVMVVGGSNDTTMNAINVNGFMDTEMDGWVGATPEQIGELLWLLKQTTVDYDVEFVLERPAEGPYDMVVFGSADDHAAAFGGTCSVQVGISDCSDAGGESIAFLFWGCLGMEDQLDPHRAAFHTLGGLGYGWGMENVAGTGQVMASYSASGLKYGDQCSMLSGASACVHEGCAMGTQNGSADMMARHGARVDDGPPVLTVVSPAAGETVQAPFNVAVEVDDAFGGVTTSLELVGFGAPPAVDETYPFGWAGIDVGDGNLTLLVKATDADGNEVSQEVPICVGGPCDPPDDTGDGDGDTTESGGEEEDEGTGGNDEVGADGEGGGGGDSKGCSTTGTSTTGIALMLLGLLALIRRRPD